ncbi:MAG: 16S rRNA (cytosine(1402)-N(4))-methyltransferase RsmH [Bacteroidetes bacterium]|nr:16S rRNA (cytosine(1402)-N(4))-methyltransferase RsmH [Bacteroidota bacterium]MBL0065900.1 16S rRNA (cytosine(1402)-N(4))-methyltransferase RsmH [Bacteroidota bacterium]MBL0137968.1 16S rRNA (cytosine(1402)-N(4))-methyltransferase RsmH [Bacteroidota bacterium]
MTTTYHDPVLLTESVDALNIVADGIYVDVTFGGGGHSREILKHLGPKGRLIGFDQDEDAQRNQIRDPRFVLVRHNYRYVRQFLRYYDVLPVNGLLADLGISSYQIDEASKGFSIRFNAPLDMRMNRQSDLTAARVLNEYPEAQLLKVLSEYGEVRNARSLVRMILELRKEKKFDEIEDFKTRISPCVDRQYESQYYAKVFQALRIEVNDELGALKELLMRSAEIIKPGGRLVVIAYHSLEDRLVKNFIARGKFEGETEKDLFGNAVEVPFRAITKKPLEASPEEIARNPRARSAKLRIAERI